MMLQQFALICRADDERTDYKLTSPSRLPVTDFYDPLGQLLLFLLPRQVTLQILQFVWAFKLRTL